MTIVTWILWVGPIGIGAGGIGLLALTSDILGAFDADHVPTWSSVAFRGLLVMVQVLTAARVVNDYWLPRWFEVVLENGERVRPDGATELGLAALPPTFLTFFVVISAINGHPLPERWEWLLHSGAFIFIVPAALHRVIERRRFPDMRVGDGLIP